MRCWSLDGRLVVRVVALALIPAGLFAGVLVVLFRGGAFQAHPSAFVAAVLLAFLLLIACIGVVVHLLGRSLGRAVKAIRLGTELMATVNPDHRLRIRDGDELGSLAAEIDRMADRLVEARTGLEREVAGATRELKAERGKLSAILEALGEGVAVATPEGRVTLANRVAHGLLGAAPGGLLGRSLFDFVDREKVAHFLDRLGSSGGVTERFSLHPASGGVLNAVMTRLFDDERAMIGFVLIFYDVTRPVRSDEERQRLLAETLLQLRNPLASIRSLSESLVEDPVFADGPGRRLLEAIHAEALRLSAIVREMGEPGRLGGAPPSWHFEAVRFSELAAITLRRLRQDGDGTVRVHLEDESASLPPVRAEVFALSAALSHLLRVALARCTPGAEPWLRPSRRGRVLQIDAGWEGRAALADLEGFLDVPLALGTTRRMTVREIVEQHLGEVWAYESGSRVGFRITLPDSEPGEPRLVSAEAGLARGAGFVGAGLRSGVAGPQVESERPDFYDFSLFDEMERYILPADRERLLSELTCVVFDVETTGLHPGHGDRIVSIAGVRVRGGAVRRGETFDALVNPRRPIPLESIKFHGISDATVAEAPPMGVVLPAFLRFAEGAVLVGHQVWFDVQFLGVEAAQLGLPPVTLTHPVLDTLLLSEVVHGSLSDHGLDVAAKRLGVIVRGRHSALGDALTTADIFVRLMELLKRRGTVTLGQAIDAERTLHGFRADDITPGAGP